MAPVTVEVAFEERYWYPEDGGEVWLSGYHPLDPASGRLLARDAPELAARGLRVAGVAGAGAHHADVLALGAAAPGRPLVLRRDPGNAFDANAIAVHVVDEGAGREPDHLAVAVGARPTDAETQLGWVPREVAAALAPELDAGTPWAAVVLREQRRSPRDPRLGVTMLLARAAAIALRVSPR